MQTTISDRWISNKKKTQQRLTQSLSLTRDSYENRIRSTTQTALSLNHLIQCLNLKRERSKHKKHSVIKGRNATAQRRKHPTKTIHQHCHCHAPPAGLDYKKEENLTFPPANSFERLFFTKGAPLLCLFTISLSNAAFPFRTLLEIARRNPAPLGDLGPHFPKTTIRAQHFQHYTSVRISLEARPSPTCLTVKYIFVMAACPAGIFLVDWFWQLNSYSNRCKEERWWKGEKMLSNSFRHSPRVAFPGAPSSIQWMLRSSNFRLLHSLIGVTLNATSTAKEFDRIHNAAADTVTREGKRNIEMKKWYTCWWCAVMIWVRYGNTYSLQVI